MALLSVRREGKKCGLKRYVGKIWVSPKSKEFSIVAIGKASSQKSVPRSCGYWEDVRMKIAFLRTEYERNRNDFVPVNMSWRGFTANVRTGRSSPSEHLP